MSKEDYQDYKRWMLSKDSFKPHPRGLDWHDLNGGQKAALARQLREQADREYYEDAMHGVPH